MNRLMVLCMAAGMAIILGCSRTEPVVEDPTTQATGRVEVTIQFPNAEPVVNSAIDINSGDTVLDVLNRIPNMKVQTNGSGEFAFVSKIGDLEAGGGEGWLFYVNDRWADQSAGIYPVKPGDKILWKYGSFSE